MRTWWVDGPQVSVNEIARRAGVSKAGLYREFGDEDGLVAAALDRYRTEVLLPRFDAMASDDPFPVVLDRLIVLATGGADLPDGCLLANLRAAPDRLGSSSAQRVAEVGDEQRSHLTAFFARAASRAEANRDIDAVEAGAFLDAQLTFVLLRMAWGDPPDVVRQHARLALSPLRAD